jgi:hypothetical protein
MTTMYRTSITATFQIEVEAESRDEAMRIVDGVIDNQPTILLVEGGDPAQMTDVLTGLHAPDGIEDVLVSAEIEGEPAVIVRGSMHRSPA